MPPQSAGPPPQQPQQPPKKAEPAGQTSQIVEKLRPASSVLVTVSANPSIDQLAACIGLTLALNKMDKHATAVYSGKTPSTIEFLKPGETLEKNTDSLRDFIISLDKSKADKLRYKVENDVVKIFITPYKTSITEKDFDFSQGDFNVDVVIALGVTKKTDLDRSITAHGKILHDAAVISMNTVPQAKNHIGSIEWASGDSSSLCEMAMDLVADLDGSVVDNQIATALLTGVVVETDRFSNDKSRPHTMQVAGKLMESGASTQLITTKLDEQQSVKVDKEPASEPGNDGVLEIEHTVKQEADEPPQAKPVEEQPKTPKVEVAPVVEEPPVVKEPPVVEKPSSDDEDESKEQPSTKEDDLKVNRGPRFVSEPPKTGGRLTANDVPESEMYDPSTDPMSQTNKGSIINRPKDKAKAKNDEELDDKSLSDIEDEVENSEPNQSDESSGDSPKPTLDQVSPTPPLDDAREAVEQAVSPDESQEAPVNKMKFDAHKFEIEENDGKEDNDKPSSPPPPVPPPMTPPES